MDHDVNRFHRCILAGGDSGAEFAGIKALTLAVFEEGIRSYFSAPGRTRTEAHAWVHSNSSSAFSFVTVCEILGLEAEAVRRALPHLKPGSTELRRVRDQACMGRRLKLTRPRSGH